MDDPTKISFRQEKQIKKYVQDYFEKAVTKKKEHDKQKAERKAREETSGTPQTMVPASEGTGEEEDSDRDQNIALSDDEEAEQKHDSAIPVTPLDQLLIAEGLKRKRETDDEPERGEPEDENATPSKRFKSESPPLQPPPPPAVKIPLNLSECLKEDAVSWGTPRDSTTDAESFIKEESVDENDHPPAPPPPPSDPDLDIANKASIADAISTPHVEMADDEREHVPDHERPFPGHGRGQLSELQV